MGVLSYAQSARAKGIIFGVSSAAAVAGMLLTSSPVAARDIENDRVHGPAVVQHPVASGWDLTGTYTVVFTCTTGCVGAFEHTMNVTKVDATGAITGNGFYDGDHSYTWTMSGKQTATTFTFTNVYNNNNAGYTLTGTGKIGTDGSLSGDATGPGQAFTWASTAGHAKLTVSPPTSFLDCMHGGYKAYNNPPFKNAGTCLQYVLSHYKPVPGSNPHNNDNSDQQGQEKN